MNNFFAYVYCYGTIEQSILTFVRFKHIISTSFKQIIDELEDNVLELEKIVDYFKELWKKFIEFLQNKFFTINKYDDFINDLYDEDILNDNDIDIIQNNFKDKDDFDRDLY